MDLPKLAEVVWGEEGAAAVAAAAAMETVVSKTLPAVVVAFDFRGPMAVMAHRRA